MIIYKITNKLNGKIYVGQTVRSMEERWTEHCKKTSDCMAISHAIQKYGKENFTIECVCVANSIEELNKKEQEFIEEFNSMKPSGYNLTSGGLNFIRSEESNRKNSESQKGEKNHNFGKKAPLEVRAKMAASRRGEKNHFFGRHHSEETKRKLAECRKKQKCPRLGTKHSEESLKKMSESHKGQIAVNRRAIKCNENGMIFASLSEASKQLGVSSSSICEVLKGKRKKCKHKGYTFSYL